MDTDTLREILESEAAAILNAITSVERHRFEYLSETIAEMGGKLIVTGVGKSAIAARKIASTLATCNVSAVFIDPVGLFHGELGFLRKDDVILMISASGETQELLRLLAPIKAIHCRIWSIVCVGDSTLGRMLTSLHTGCSVDPVLKVPTTSSAVTVAIGDALAIDVARRNSFDDSKLAAIHPGGTIGAELRSLVTSNGNG